MLEKSRRDNSSLNHGAFAGQPNRLGKGGINFNDDRQWLTSCQLSEVGRPQDVYRKKKINGKRNWKKSSEWDIYWYMQVSKRQPQHRQSQACMQLHGDVIRAFQKGC